MNAAASIFQPPTSNLRYLFFVFKKKRSILPVHTHTQRRKGHPRVPSWTSHDTHDENNQYQTLKKSREKKFMILSTQPPEPRKWIRMMRRTQPMTPKGKGINKNCRRRSEMCRACNRVIKGRWAPRSQSSCQRRVTSATRINAIVSNRPCPARAEGSKSRRGWESPSHPFPSR